VGAQKAGTSWFHWALREQKNFRDLGAKELHFWDWHFDLHRKNSVSEKDMDTFRVHGQPARAAKLAQREEATYFKKVSAASATGSLTADITPA